MGISNLIPYDVLLSIAVASIVLLLMWFILSVRSNYNKSKEYDEELFKQPPPSNVCEVNDMLQQLSTADNDNDVSVCASCGKEGSDNMNVCNKCKMVKYCNATCKKKHRSKHKKDCEEYVRLAAKLHDEKLFKRPPPLLEDCPICTIRLPSLHTGLTYKSCCGKLICTGCILAPVYDHQGNKVDNRKCPFCRVSAPETEEVIKRTKKRMEANDPIAIYNIGCWYDEGLYGLPQDYVKALELYHRAGELGYSKAYCNVGFAYDNGIGVEVDKKKALDYYELAAMGGDEEARHNLGVKEKKAGNFDRALKHHMIAVSGGYSDSLNKIQRLYTNVDMQQKKTIQKHCNLIKYT